MADIELFHYYRQDVLGIRVKGERFCDVGRDHMVLHLEEALDHVRKVCERCRKKYSVVEQIVLTRDGRGEQRKIYRVCVYGKQEQIGMLFNLNVPVKTGVADSAREGPFRQPQNVERFLKERKIF